MPARTGQEFLSKLDDGRDIWVDGEKVENVPEHPAFAGAARALGEVYGYPRHDARGLRIDQQALGALRPDVEPEEKAQPRAPSRCSISSWSRRSYRSPWAATASTSTSQRRRFAARSAL